MGTVPESAVHSPGRLSLLGENNKRGGGVYTASGEVGAEELPPRLNSASCLEGPREGAPGRVEAKQEHPEPHGVRAGRAKV